MVKFSLIDWESFILNGVQMNYDKIYFYDVESFPSFACFTFLEDKTGDYIQFKFGCGYNDLADLKDFTSNRALYVGFNQYKLR